MRTHAVTRRQLRSVNIDALRFDSDWVVRTREEVSKVFGVEPCLWQVKVSLAVLRGDKHVLSISRTGSGKTLTFWIPVLLTNDGIQIVVIPLNLLGKQNVEQLVRVGISAIVLTSETATPSNFAVSTLTIIHWQVLTYILFILRLSLRGTSGSL